MDKKIISIIWTQYSGRIACTCLAALLGFIYLKCGFWKTLVFSLVILLGYCVGRYIDREEGWKEAINRVFVKRWIDK